LAFLVLAVVWQFVAYQRAKQAEVEAVNARMQVARERNVAQFALLQVARARQEQTQGSISAHRVYMQYVGSDGWALCKQIGSLLQSQGYVVPGSEKVALDLSPSKSQVHYFHPEDKDTAAKIAAIVAGSVSGLVNPSLQQIQTT
jgi:hypothetical protein